MNRDSPPRPSWLRSRLAKWAFYAYRLGLGRLLGRWVLVLATRGRETGRVRKTPLWYVRESDLVYCLSGWGTNSDWYLNVKAHHLVVMEIGKDRRKATAELVDIPSERERVLGLIEGKYGSPTTRLFYHLDRIALVAFTLDSEQLP